MMETWKPIPGYENAYEISDIGRVRSKDRYVKGFNSRYGEYQAFRLGRVRSAKTSKSGYPMINLLHGGIVKWFSIHFLVLSAFVSPRPSKDHQCNHKNGVKNDNRLENLEWVTRSENMRHAQRTGLWNFCGEAHDKAILTASQVLNIRHWKISTNLTHQQMASYFGVSKSCVTHIVAGRTWKHV